MSHGYIQGLKKKEEREKEKTQRTKKKYRKHKQQFKSKKTHYQENKMPLSRGQSVKAYWEGWGGGRRVRGLLNITNNN